MAAAVLSPIPHHKSAPYSFGMSGLTSAAGLVGFLSEPDAALRSFALQRLNEDIDLLWPEVAGSVGQMYVIPNAIVSSGRACAERVHAFSATLLLSEKLRALANVLLQQ
jgi:hypothetical protein